VISSTKNPRGIKLCIALCVAVVGMQSPAAFAETAPMSPADKVATHVMQGFIKHDFTKAETDFDDRMKQALPPDQLKDKWDKRTGTIDDVKMGELHDTPYQEYMIVWVRTIVGQHYFWTKIVVDRNQKVAGLSFSPSSEKVRILGT